MVLNESRMTAPEVSIVVPTYNGAAYLEEALESALGQTWTDFELVVCDDCSTDTTVTIVEQYCKADDRVRLVRNPETLGLVGNWNRCIEEARGKWVKFLFQDDVLHPTCVERMMQDADSHDFVLCDRNFIIADDADPGLRDFYENRVPHYHDVSGCDGQISPQQVAEQIIRMGPGNNFFGEPPSVLIRKGLFDAFGLFGEAYIHICDLEFWTRAASNTGLFYINEPLVLFRVHEKSASMDNHRFRKFDLEYLDVLNLLWAYETDSVYEKLRLSVGGKDVFTRIKTRVLSNGIEAAENLDGGSELFRIRTLAALMEKPMAPVSVVIPCFRCGATLERAVESIGAQTLLPQEVILVDDGSEDDTWQSIKAVQNRFGASWIKAVRSPDNRGAGEARNQGWDRARGDYVAFLDADDTWHPEKISVHHAVMESHPEIAASGHGCGDVVSCASMEDSNVRLIPAWHLLFRNPFKTSAVMVRKGSSLRFAEGKRYSEDFLLWCEMAFGGHSLGWIHEPLAALHKPSYGSGGLSKNLRAMEAGELDVFRRLKAEGKISAAGWCLASAVSVIKYVKRLIRVRLGLWE